MDTAVNQQELELKLINRFKEEFYSKTGKMPIVILRGEAKDAPYPRLSLDVLEKFIRSYLPMVKGQRAKLSTPSRKREVVVVRMLYCKLATQMGHTCTEIADRTNKHYTTVLHALKTVDNLLATRDTDVTDLYNTMIHHLNNPKPHETTIRSLDQAQTDAQPVLSAVSF